MAAVTSFKNALLSNDAKTRPRSKNGEGKGPLADKVDHYERSGDWRGLDVEVRLNRN